jgi:hypothetical protein
MVELVFSVLRNYQNQYNEWACSIFHLEIDEKKKRVYSILNDIKLKLHSRSFDPKAVEMGISAVIGFYSDVYLLPVSEFIEDYKQLCNIES